MKSMCTSTLSSLRGNRQFLHAGVGLFLLAAATTLAMAATPREAQARYQSERAACSNGASHQDRSTCLREAAAVLAEQKSGRRSQSDPQVYSNNRLIRCDRLTPQDREDCLQRMKGEGTLSGSVESGGLYRELSRPAVPSPAN